MTDSWYLHGLVASSKWQIVGTCMGWYYQLGSWKYLHGLVGKPWGAASPLPASPLSSPVALARVLHAPHNFVGGIAKYFFIYFGKLKPVSKSIK